MLATSLSQKVRDELTGEPDLSSAHITVDDRAGVITLTGTVPSFREKRFAAMLAAEVEGVKSVSNELVVRVSGGGLDDHPEETNEPVIEDVEIKIRQALHRGADIDADRIHVSIDRNKVVLRGIVRTAAEAALAESAAWAARGVEEVESHLRSDDELAGL